MKQDSHIPYSRQTLLQAIALNPEEISFDTLQRLFGFTNQTNEPLKADIDDLIRQRVIHRATISRFAAVKPIADMAYARVKEISAQGDVMLELEGEKDLPFHVTLKKKEARRYNLKKNDRIFVHLKRNNGFELKAEVLCKVEWHTRPPLTGTFKKSANGNLVFSVLRNGRTVFRPTGNVPKKITPGKVFNAIVPGDYNPRDPEVFIDSTRWEPKKGDKLSYILADRYQLATRHSPQAQSEARKITQKRMNKYGRRDLSNIPFLGVDPANSPGDADDVVYAEHTPDGGIRTIVAIADIASIVLRGTAIDDEARARGWTHYFPDEKEFFHVLPPLIATQYAALQPNKTKAVIYCERFFGRDGTLLDTHIGPGFIRAQRHINYDQLQTWMNNPSKELFAYLDYAEMTAERVSGKRLHFKHGRNLPGDAPARSLIEDFALDTNMAKAAYLDETGVPFLRRAHEPPVDNEKFHTASTLLREWGYPAPDTAHACTNTLLNDIQNMAFTRGEGELVQNLIRTHYLSRAVYTARSAPHAALGAWPYGHFTSPIWRLSDLQNQRALYRSWGNVDLGLTDEDIDNLPNLANHLNRLKDIHEKVERDAALYSKICALQPYEGKQIQAKLSAIHDNGDIEFSLTGFPGLYQRMPANKLPAHYRIPPDKQGLCYGASCWLPLDSTFLLEVGMVEPHRGTWSINSFEHTNIRQTPLRRPVWAPGMASAA